MLGYKMIGVKIIAPNPWFGPSASDLDTSDIIPDRWEIIDWSLLE